MQDLKKGLITARRSTPRQELMQKERGCRRPLHKGDFATLYKSHFLDEQHSIRSVLAPEARHSFHARRSHDPGPTRLPVFQLRRPCA